MRRTHLVLLATAVSLSAPGLCQSQAAVSMPPVPEVAVSAAGSATRKPDHAEMTLEVATDRSTAAGASAINAEIQQRVLDTLASMGYGNDAISTTMFTVYQLDDYGDSERDSVPTYRARNDIRVKIADLTKIGSTIDAALAAGATQVENVKALSTEAEDARREALADATSKARLDAETLARSLGGHLGNLLSVSTDVKTSIAEVLTLQQGFTGSRTTPINTGDLTIEAAVTVRWVFVSGIR